MILVMSFSLSCTSMFNYCWAFILKEMLALIVSTSLSWKLIDRSSTSRNSESCWKTRVAVSLKLSRTRRAIISFFWSYPKSLFVMFMISQNSTLSCCSIFITLKPSSLMLNWIIWKNYLLCDIVEKDILHWSYFKSDISGFLFVSTH